MLTRRALVRTAGLAAPTGAAFALLPLRDAVANTNAALLLVVVVVAVASRGDRVAGVCAALCAAFWFDFLLTRPYQRLSIAARADIETTVLLLVVGVAVTELAVWGRAQQARASRLTGYADGLQDALATVAGAGSTADLVDRVARQIAQVLQLRSCRFDYASGVVGGRHPRLRPDGEVEVDGAVCDVERFGLPVRHEIEIPVTSGDAYLGRFVLSAGPDARPQLGQRLVAVALAERVAGKLHPSGGRATPNH